MNFFTFRPVKLKISSFQCKNLDDHKKSVETLNFAQFINSEKFLNLVNFKFKSVVKLSKFREYYEFSILTKGPQYLLKYLSQAPLYNGVVNLVSAVVDFMIV